MEIKDYRNKEIPLLLIGCTLLFLIISGEIEDTVGTTILSWIFSAVSGSVVSIFAFLGDAFISSKTKDFIVTLGKKFLFLRRTCLNESVRMDMTSALKQTERVQDIKQYMRK